MDIKRLKDLEMAAFNLGTELEEFCDTLPDGETKRRVQFVIHMFAESWLELEALVADTKE